ncbi:hypothetical protein KP509_18G072700 [Ceratopteris richardii]|uniref:Uncharacterized protein n=1 Tax=Ceratopteris richardii TaxID=49495 RepID=A0A8T2SST7_CERRI|nr:hypothetical protein KP509_18G072700 [Ceratopteris richardii]
MIHYSHSAFDSYIISMAKTSVGRRRRRSSSAADILTSPRASASLFPSPSPLIATESPIPTPANLSVADIRLSLSSRLETLRKDADLMHSSLLKEITTASSRLSKRVKLELHACTQQIDDVEKECDAFSADFKEDMEEIKEYYEEFMSRAQNSASHYLKKGLSDLMSKMEKDLEKLRSRFATT